MDKYILYTDGGARGNPGPAATGIVIYDKDSNEIATFSSFLGRATNNQAEYKAVILGLGHIQKLINDQHRIAETDVEVRIDSELIVKQLNNEYRVKNQGLKPLFVKLKTLINQFNQVNFRHIPREANKKADSLVNVELDQHC